MPPVYYTLDQEIQRGPYTQTQIKSMWDSGTLTATAQCWQEGWAEWRPVSDLLMQSQVAPPVPQKSVVLDYQTREFTEEQRQDIVARRSKAYGIDFLILLLFGVGPLVLNLNFEWWHDANINYWIMGIAASWLIIRDSIAGGRSPGKLHAGLVCISTRTGLPANPFVSAARNLTTILKYAAVVLVWVLLSMVFKGLVFTIPLMLIAQWVMVGSEKESIRQSSHAQKSIDRLFHVQIIPS